MAATLQRVITRRLRPAEPLPASEPKRYKSSHGYVRLRWLVAPQVYVEEYEHRLNAGRPSSRFDVHHINGDKQDNRPENLKVVTPDEHRKIHEVPGLHGRPRGKPQTKSPDGVSSRDAKRARRIERERSLTAQVGQMRDLYAQGKGTVEIGHVLGIHPSQVSRRLRAAGVLMRPAAITTDNALARSKQLVRARDQMRCFICEHSVAWEPGEVHHRIGRGMGGTSRPVVNSPANLILLCRPCHAGITAERSPDAERLGYVIRRRTGVDPAAVPTYSRRYQGWVLLTEDGGIEHLTEPDRAAG